MTVKVHQKIREKNSKGKIKERIQIFEGIILAHKHKKEVGNTITVRKISESIGVEKIFPVNSPNIIKNYYHYRINLNKTIAENRLVVEKSYNVTGLYSLKRMDTTNFYNLGKQIENNSTIFKTYCKLYYDTPFNYTCSANLKKEIFV